MSNTPPENRTSEQPQVSTAEPTTAPGDDVAPPNQGQIRRELAPPTSAPATSDPGDSKPLRPGYLNLLNDGIADQESRRENRKPILVAALTVLAVFTACLATVVLVLSCGFHQALKPENIAKFVAVELREKIAKISTPGVDKEVNSTKDDAAKKTADKDSKLSTAKPATEHSTSKEPEPVKVDAKIYGEIRDSMVPLVGLVSILAVAIVVILGTMLKAAFAPHPHNSADLKEPEETSSVPLIEALKGLVDSIKALWK